MRFRPQHSPAPLRSAKSSWARGAHTKTWSSSSSGGPVITLTVYDGLPFQPISLPLSLPSSLQRFSHILEQDHQLERVYGRWVEVEILIKPSGRIVDRVDHYRPDPYNVRGLFDPLESIEQ